MKYRIVGADGNTYGPVTLEQLRQWLTEGRVDSRTPVYVEGATNWTYISLLPEFAPAQPPTPPAASPIQPLVLRRGTNGFATAGLVCSLLAWTICCCCGGLPFNLLGLVFSIVALVQISAQADPQDGRGLAIIGLVLSSLSLLFGLFYGVFQLATNPGSINWSTSFQ